jgi:hypothetical protein
MPSRFVRSLALSGVLAATLGTGAARADVLFSNIGFGSTVSNPVSQVLYDSFSTGSYGVSLTSVSLKLEASNPSDTGAVVVALYSNLSGSNTPDGSIQRLGKIFDSSLTSSPTIIQLDAFPYTALAANTRYWIQVRQLGSTPSSASWVYDNSYLGTSVSTEYSLDTVNVAGVTANDSGSNVYLMRVTGIPEPRSVALLLVGLVGTGLALLRRRFSVA